MSVVVETERMTLRRFTGEDLERLVELDNDPEVMRYINNGQPVDQAEVADALSSWIEGDGHDDHFGFLAAVESSSDRFVGWFHFRHGDDADLGIELGYRLCRSAWGRGLATEGSRALIDTGFRTLAVRRVYAHTMAVHAASRRVMEKAGLRMVRTFDADWPVRIPGDELGDVEYALERSEWMAQTRRR